MPISYRAAALAALTLPIAVLAPALAKTPLTIVHTEPVNVGRCQDNAATNLGQPGSVFECTCPADDYISGDIWGTDTYTHDTHICTAAYHAGAAQRGAGGMVTFQLMGPQDGFSSSERNGLKSRSWGAFDGSFRFVEYQPESDGAAMSEERKVRDLGRCEEADLTTMRGSTEEDLLSCSCPADTYISGDIWGTGTYTDDTHICTAAYHDGVMARGAGGTVVFELAGPQEDFPSSVRNGLESREWGTYQGSFRFVKPD